MRQWWLEQLDRELQTATGLVEEARHEGLFDRYVGHVSMWLKGERYRDPVTGDLSDPDPGLLKRVEAVLEVKNAEEFRRNLINVIAAFAIDHPNAPLEPGRIFPRYLEQLKESYFLEHRGQIAALIADMLATLSDGAQTLAPEPRKLARAAVDRLLGAGYCPNCARAALGELFKERYR